MVRLWHYMYLYLSKVESEDLLILPEWDQFLSLVSLVPEDEILWRLGFHYVGVHSFSHMHISSGLLDM